MQTDMWLADVSIRRPVFATMLIASLVLQASAPFTGVLGAVRDFVDQSKTPLIVSNAGNDEATGAA